MILESFGVNGEGAARTEATRLVVRDSHGNPRVLVSEIGPDVLIAAHWQDDDFDAVARAMGVDITKVRVTRFRG